MSGHHHEPPGLAAATTILGAIILLACCHLVITEDLEEEPSAEPTNSLTRPSLEPEWLQSHNTGIWRLKPTRLKTIAVHLAGARLILNSKAGSELTLRLHRKAIGPTREEAKAALALGQGSLQLSARQDSLCLFAQRLPRLPAEASPPPGAGQESLSLLAERLQGHQEMGELDHITWVVELPDTLAVKLVLLAGASPTVADLQGKASTQLFGNRHLELRHPGGPILFGFNAKTDAFNDPAHLIANRAPGAYRVPLG